MYTEKDNLAFVWEDFNGGASILRVYSDIPDISIPEEINGKKVVSVGAYCFSGINKTGYTQADIPCLNRLYEYCGNNVESVILPDTLEIIGDNAFYNCRKLVLIEVGASLKETGSDVFMNCICFTKLYLRQKADMPGGLKQIASRISSHLDVYFYNNGKIHAMLVFPEYTESYDEIAPAHIFGRNITGEGFRARQCFNGRVFDFKQYDRIFAKASAEESISVIYKMALGRLMYPFMLEDMHRKQYEEYIKCHQEKIMGILAAERWLEALYFMCSNRYADANGIANAASKALQAGWSEGVASLLKWKHEFIKNAREKRYEF